MTLLIRSLQASSRALFQPRLKTAGEPARHSFRVLPIDIDVYRHMNHARYLNYLEAARWALQLRSGFLRVALKKGWIGPIARLQIDYYRPLTVFQKFEITTQFVHFEEKWFHILQRVWSGEKEMARALITGTVRKGRANVPPSEYLAALGYRAEDLVIPPDVTKWVNEKLR